MESNLFPEAEDIFPLAEVPGQTEIQTKVDRLVRNTDTYTEAFHRSCQMHWNGICPDIEAEDLAVQIERSTEVGAEIGNRVAS